MDTNKTKCPNFLSFCALYDCNKCIHQDKPKFVGALKTGFYSESDLLGAGDITPRGLIDGTNGPKRRTNIETTSYQACTAKTNPPSTPIKSDGGSSSYYDFMITNAEGESIHIKTGDVIRDMVSNDYDLGNIVKACRRIDQSRKGRGKAGTNVRYDLKKIIYMAEELLKNES